MGLGFDIFGHALRHCQGFAVGDENDLVSPWVIPGPGQCIPN